MMTRKPNPTAYHLIDEEIHSQSVHEESCWDTDHRGAGEYYPPTYEYRSVKSVNTRYPTFRKRNITEEHAGVLTFECSYRNVSGDGFYLGFRGNKEAICEAFVLRQKAGVLCAGDTVIVETDTAWHYLKLVLDIDRRLVQIHLDGKYVLTVPFTGPAASICRLEYGYGKEALGETTVHADLKLYKNYLFNDQLICHFDGALPEEYVLSTTGDARAVRRLYHEGSKYAVYDLAAKAGAVTVIDRAFAPTDGVVGYEMKYLLPAAGGRLTVSFLRDGTEVISVYDDLRALCAGDATLRVHSPNVWQTLRIEADTSSGTAFVRLNGKIAATVEFLEAVEFLDGIRLRFDAYTDATLLFTELKAFPIPPYPADYVPAPVLPQKKGDYYVGMNICSLWRTGTHYGWDCITPFKENKPYLGYYDEGVAETADWELKWMAEHGLDFQLYCWYGSETNMPMVKTMLSKEIYDGHMLAKYSDTVKLALLWEAMSACPRSFDDFKNYFVPLFIDYFFSDDRYMQIDGVSIMSVYAPDRLAKELGGAEHARQAFAYLREEVKKLGYKDLAILCCGESGPPYRDCGIDAVHAYNLGHHGADLDYTKSYNKSNAEEGSLHCVPTVSMGYNWLAWSGERHPVLAPDDMAEALTWCKEEIVDKVADRASWKSKLLMLSTWNEYGEGTFMCPANVHGFGYLDALRKVFCEDTPHTDVVPNKEQLDRICILHPQDRALLAPLDTLPKDNGEYGIIKQYTFKTEEDLALWEMHGPMTFEQKDGQLVGHSHGQDPYMILHDDSFLPISTEQIGKITAYIKTSKPVDQMDVIEQKYQFENGTWYPRHLYEFTKPLEIAPLTIEPAKKKGFPWHETLYGFRFDPVWGVGDFVLDRIEFHAQKPHRVFKVNGQVIDLCHEITLDENTPYIPFDTKSALKKLPGMYYEWDAPTQTLTIFGEKVGRFVIGEQIVQIDDTSLPLKKTFSLCDGIPHIEATVLAEILGMDVRVETHGIELTSKNGNA